MPRATDQSVRQRLLGALVMPVVSHQQLADFCPAAAKVASDVPRDRLSDERARWVTVLHQFFGCESPAFHRDLLAVAEAAQDCCV